MHHWAELNIFQTVMRKTAQNILFQTFPGKSARGTFTLYGHFNYHQMMLPVHLHHHHARLTHERHHG